MRVFLGHFLLSVTLLVGWAGVVPLAGAQVSGSPADYSHGGVSFHGAANPALGTLAQAGGTLGQSSGLDAQGSGFGAADVVSVTGQFTAPSDGEPSRLFLTAAMEPGWHIYSITQGPGGPVKTTISVDTSAAYHLAGEFVATSEPESKAEELFGGLIVESHYQSVTWQAPLELAPGVDPASLEIRGKIKAQPCDPNSCLPPTDFAFVARLGPGLELAAQPAGIRSDQQPVVAGSGIPPGRQPSAGATVFDPTALSIDEGDSSLAGAMGLGFLGGLILNLMPCVLPVIGLKILSFVEQSGHDRRQALLLNVWYSLGLMSVFLLLATLAAFLGFGWGQLFSYQGFNITLAAVVFAMGLSFLGVWEVPIPGFAGSGKSNEWTAQEGASGAFAKGVLTTILATPCSAPFLAPAVAWAVAQPPLWTYAVFTSVGLGMASPYLAIGAFPQLIRFLPRPGAWMETFKEVMGFVLLGTVVFILTFIPWAYVVPTIGLLFGLWAACWWIGRTPVTVASHVKVRAWLTAVAITGLVWLVTFGWLLDVMTARYELAVRTAGVEQAAGENELPWQPFSRPLFEELIAAEKTVMVDFTADWCLTCKTLEAYVLNTSQVKQAVEANGVVTLRADWTNREPHVSELLEQLGGKQVPTLAIFPAGNPNSPVRLRGGYTIQKVVDILTKAGAPQLPAPDVAETGDRVGA